MLPKTFILGLLAAILLLTLYFSTMTLLSGWKAAVEQFQNLWWLMLPLSAGFGIQTGLYLYLKQQMAGDARRGAPQPGSPPWADVGLTSGRTRQAMVTGGTSASISMLACCMHHATDALPFIGLSGLSIFLTRYQIPILLISLIINIIGIKMMLNHLQLYRV
ncbi:MAG: hypothetical protein UV61_C0009G0037 [Candidatus Gottesmanbacteria bacterium GW2011_GWB1_43_11]|uniref:Uncharacterized protein n=1 Tax=Candidatus Gottesmanbacteria bacterium GW2011_GWB1_43_11 TaxID=1618446 RepID=A0A0G1CL19_9BACT|nr:MAG: hypothetical protein UV17_C0031G0008 [Candidatus Gottesmanbacteria bacterium GW2011_GWA1_42_26]KKS81391.1 MAG: hypothetical protein UV55_C0015G0037 [Candidatus Gottesmanbacteria bacterium GW2011_GWC1_43_10]KKS86510.1 MAG: hypothetical protein UV61_C0009G0037 [Candidatus Gottesmanbacteria bacterium GW2011_GWB1_43_11]OGG07467.1 MAG: hypothetical protein A2699_03070 [Candidatus Gottesmanbacteria bacterium RIFCSPHIGHO2_01_FULL_43_15]OGG26513.1 MAG: hypothetical protein A3A59_06165 [Candidat